MYLTIRNLPKCIRRKPSHQGQILLAYLLTTHLTHIHNKAARCQALANLFHAYIGHIVGPLWEAGINGMEIISGDGVHHCGHPILVSYVGDYPEQCSIISTYTGDCPICECPHSDLGRHPCGTPYHDLDTVLDALEQIGLPSYSAACWDARVKPLQCPFWANLPFVNIFWSITPNLLHQLYQRVIQHLVSWLTDICGATEIDARVCRLPPNHSIQNFWKGITILTYITGTEHRQIASFLLGLVSNIELPKSTSSAQLTSATHLLLDFLYLAQYPVHNNSTL